MASEGSGGDSPTLMASQGICDVRTSPASIITALCYGLLIPPTVIGNGLVVISFIINPKIRTATNIFILGLALSDLLIGSFSLPLWTYIVSYDSLSVGNCLSLYQAYICMDILTGCASILQLTAIAVERLFFTVAPFRHRKLSRAIYYIMLITAWLFSTFVAALQPVQSQSWEQVYSVFLLVTCFIIPLAVIIFVYLYILKVVRHQARPRQSTRHRMGSTGAHIKEFNIFITVIVITGLFITAWMPFFVVTVVASFCTSCLPPVPQVYHLVKFVKWMQYSSSSVNPYIYAYRNVELKRTYKRMLNYCLCGRNSMSSNSNTHPVQGSDRKLNAQQNGRVNACFKDEGSLDHSPGQQMARLDFGQNSGRKSGQSVINNEEVVSLGPRGRKISLELPKVSKRGSLPSGGNPKIVDVGKLSRKEGLGPSRERERIRSGSMNDIIDRIETRAQQRFSKRQQHPGMQSDRAHRNPSVHRPIPEFYENASVASSDSKGRIRRDGHFISSTGLDSSRAVMNRRESPGPRQDERRANSNNPARRKTLERRNHDNDFERINEKISNPSSEVNNGDDNPASFV